MTAQEAKQHLERIWKDYTSAYDIISEDDVTAFDMAINSVGVIDQYRWERDIAIQQLKDLGYEFGEKPRKDDTISRRVAIRAIANHDGVVDKSVAKRILVQLPSMQPETAKRIVGKSMDGMTMWYQCDMCNEPVDIQDAFCRGCGRRFTDERPD